MREWKNSPHGCGENGIRVVTVARHDETLYRRCGFLEYRVFVESGYVKENPETRVAALDSYPHHVFMAALAGSRKSPPEDREVTGVMRIVYAPHADKMGPGLFPTLDHAEELRIAPEKLARIMAMDPMSFIDIATMAVPKEKRDTQSSRALITAVIQHIRMRPPLRYALAAIDTVFYGKLKSRGLPFEDLGPSVPYWGSPSTATLGDSRLLKGAWKPAVAGYVFRGQGRMLR
jgi:hypothetical protein